MPRATIKNFSREPAQVFFDPTHHRWLAVKSITMLGIVCLLGLLALVAVRVISGPELSRFSLVPPENRMVLNTDGFNSGNGVERREPGVAPGFFS